ncbi:MAG TPA: DMT family transporter [Candidatus Dormibacteraeota bacterium]|nr:DMT family transporter [Candidatus Dormibacteraeota bacterium]
MVAILGGLGAALSWAIATLASSRTSRMIGPMSVLGWVMVVGLVAAIVPAALARPVDLGLPEVAGLIALGLCQNFGLLLAYYALQVGRVSIVAPIVATEGALAAALSIVLGEPLALSTALILAAIAAGVVLASVERPREDRAVDPTRTARDLAHPQRAILLAIAAAATFSIGLVLSGRLGAGGMPPAWVIVASRTVGIVLIALPLIVTRRFRLTRPALPLVVLAGILEAVGSAIYVVAASSDIAVAAVLSSQFAAIAAVGGFLLFGERLQRVQVAGVAVVAIGVTALSAVRP